MAVGMEPSVERVASLYLASYPEKGTEAEKAAWWVSVLEDELSQLSKSKVKPGGKGRRRKVNDEMWPLRGKTRYRFRQEGKWKGWYEVGGQRIYMEVRKPHGLFKGRKVRGRHHPELSGGDIVLYREAEPA